MFVLITGCRPNEAAYIVHENSVQKNDFPDFKDCVWKATMPKEVTKTKRDYKWRIPSSENEVVGLLRVLHKWRSLKKDLDTRAKFHKNIDDFYTRIVLKDAEKDNDGFTEFSPSEQRHTMRTIRSWHGTQWAMEAELAKRAGRPLPFNPLQHVNNKTLLRHYAVNAPDAVEAGREELRRRETKLREKQAMAAKRAIGNTRQRPR